MFASLLQRLGAARARRLAHHPDRDPKHAQEGKRPEGPPDLDQLWRDFNDRLGRLFGARSGGGGDGWRGDMKGAGVTVTVVAVLILLIWLASGSFIVQTGQVGVVSTFGRVTQVAGPGFNWRWPYPFQSSRIVNVAELRNLEVGYHGSVRTKTPSESLMLTGDNNIVDLQFAVQYTVKDPVAWLFAAANPEENVRQLAEGAMRAAVGRSRIDTLLYGEREALAREVQQRLQVALDHYGAGVNVASLGIQAVQAPDQVQGAFEEAARADQESERARNEAQAYAASIISDARAKASRLQQDAEAQRAAAIGTATGDAARFNQVAAEYAKAPGVTRDRMYIDTMQHIYSNVSKVMIDAKANGNTLYLPLDKLAQQTIANDTAARAAAQAQAAAQAGQGAPAAVPADPAPIAAAPGTSPAAAPADAVPVQDPHRDNARSRENGRERETR